MTIRSLPLRHMAKLVNQARDAKPSGPEKLGPDQMRLFSYYKPSLVAGDYTIEVKQEITATTRDKTNVHKQHLVVTNIRDVPDPTPLQQFEVMVPRFTLDPALINSYYPPAGHQDEGRVLPHIVLNDPHYPWEIAAGVNANMNGVIDNGRSIVPWVALLVFDPEELRLDWTDIQNLNIQGLQDVTDQNQHGTFQMPVSQYLSSDSQTGTPSSSRVKYEAGYKNPGTGLDGKPLPDDLTGWTEISTSSDLVNIIFPKKDLVNSIFPSVDDLAAFKYLAHVRQINTVGFPDAGVEEEGLFSTIISGRTGAFDITQSKTQICHLVSIEHLDSTLGSLTTLTPFDRIGLVSLFSWVYTALPPNPVNFVDTMMNLTNYQQMLRVDDKKLHSLETESNSANGTKSKYSFSKRLRLGYTIARWRPETGEETVALNRGPLVPQRVIWPPVPDLPSTSNTSKELQILDPETGLMDLSYSSAWQVGKLLAISDTVFSAAVMRFRSAVYNSSAYQTRMTMNGMESRSVLMNKIAKSIATIQTQSVGETGQPERIVPCRGLLAQPGLKHMDALPTFKANLKAVISQSTRAGEDIYNEFNLDKPNNSDWVTIFSWIADKLSLGDIPPQYLVPEPSYLPPESLRFFHIDDFWLDCLIDGALSVANHLDRENDRIRNAIKEIFNYYLQTVVPEAGYKPQIPCYGFAIRSQLIKAMPDLRISVNWANPDKRAPVCRWTKWDDQTLFCLLDREPEELLSSDPTEKLSLGITLAQPPHQQRFSLGEHLDPNATPKTVTFLLRQLYTTNAPSGSWPQRGFPSDKETLPNDWLDWESRCLKLNQMATDLNSLLQLTDAGDGKSYVDPTPNSCELGLELNDPSYFFSIIPPKPPSDFNPNMPSRNRQLYIQGETPAAKSPVPLAGRSSVVKSPSVKQTESVSTVATDPPKPSKPQPPAGPLHQSLIQPPNIQPRISPRVPKSLLTSQLGAIPRLHQAAMAAINTITPRYDLVVYPDYKSPPVRTKPLFYSKADFVPTSNLYFYDLVFSLRKKPTLADSSYKLLSLLISIPTPTSVAATEVPLLGQSYDGPGVRMLSNQRFIPFLYNQDNRLYVEVVPRTANDNYNIVINDGKTREMSFRLAEANVVPGGPKSWVTITGDGPDRREQVALVKVTLTEVYSTAASPAGQSATSTFMVVKRDAVDDPF